MLGALLSGEGRRVTAHFGGTLSIIYSSESINARPTSRPVGIMPLLVILFIVSYGILTMLVFEQGQTIESQRSLIREMLKDSTQLAAIKDKLAREDVKRMQSKTFRASGAERLPMRPMRRPAQNRRTRRSNDPARPLAPRKFRESRPPISKMCAVRPASFDPSQARAVYRASHLFRPCTD